MTKPVALANDVAPRLVSGGDKYDSCGGRKSDSRQHDLAAGWERRSRPV